MDDELREGGVESPVRERERLRRRAANVDARVARPRAATNGSDGSTAATALGPSRRQFARERARATPDVEGPLPAATEARSATAGQQARVPTHEAA